MKITRAVVPSLFTILNAFCGFLSIIQTSQGNIHLAGWFILLAAIFDSLDGVMARITKSCSQFGVELDSLSDVVSFGAAPSFMVYVAYLNTLGTLGVMIAALPLAMGAIRLARFNVQLVGFDKDYFNGLPIPMQAITVCAFLLEFSTDHSAMSPINANALAILVIVLSLLMVSHVKYDTLPKISKKQIVAHPWKVVSIVIAALIVLFSRGHFLFYMLMCFIAFGIIRSMIVWFKKSILKIQTVPTEQSELSSIDL
ncbi:MAG TPA: CDP-diacylglycerol--serine O-phosphatidyltransferase [Bacteroidota bacterium]|nr:CDP-diacylglycerol--serine O-phosphatidyltransferase [Bacteroidota bacterium]